MATSLRDSKSTVRRNLVNPARHTMQLLSISISAVALCWMLIMQLSLTDQ